MKRKLLAVATLCVVLAAGVSAFGQVLKLRSSANGDSKESARPMPLVNADPEIGVYVSKIETLLGEKSYDEALRMIQELLEKGQTLGFFESSADGRSYESVLARVNKLLGKMDADGLAKYRTLNDPQAGKLYQDGLAAGDISMLHRVADRYLYSSYGPKAIDALGALYFDTGRFYQAASCWRRLLKLNIATESAPLLRAKVAAALYLAGDSKAGDEMAQLLKKESSDVTAIICGRDQKLADFLDNVKALPVQAVASASRASAAGWPGWGGVPDGLCPMDDVDVALSPRWAYSNKPVAELGGNVVGELLVSQNSMNITGQAGGYRAIMELHDGQIQVRHTQNNNGSNDGPGVNYRFARQSNELLPGMIHPVVFEGKVIVRTGERIVARDLLDGQIKWQTAGMTMQRQASQQAYYYGPPGRIVDTGKYALTIGDGKVYGLSDFRVVNPQPVGAPGAKPDKSGDGNRLVAVWAKSGKLVNNWEVGAGKGDDEVLRECKFITAPTYSNGRLYLLSVYLDNSFYLLCLSAQNGQLIWKQFLAQTPPPPANMGYGMPTPDMIGTPPAVVDEKVYALTNSGVVGAFDAVNGQPLWAYQYDANKSQIDPNMGQVMPPSGHNGNPLIVTRGRVICLPADSEQVLALSCEDGLPAWKAPRSNQEDLTGIDDGRILLSGQGLAVLSTTDGHTLADTSAKGINGRPAVSTKSVLASGSGVFYRLNLGDYKLTATEVSDGEALLGNLVTTEGKLISANAAGVCAYFKYDEVRQRIAEKIAAASPADKPDQILYGGQLAMNSHQFGDAIADITAAMDLARQQGNDAFLAKAGAALYKAYLAAGNAADKPQQMIAQFQHALDAAPGNSEKALMNIRLAKAYALAGQFDKAVASAQNVIEKYPQEDLTDVPVGTKSTLSGRSRIKEQPIKGQLFGKRLIDGFIEQGGRECYKAFDAQADGALKVASAKGDLEGLLAIENRWPNATCVGGALLQAAELSYKAAGSKPAKEAQDMQDQAIRLLERVCHGQAGSRNISARVALATILAHGDTLPCATILADGLRDAPAHTDVAFGNIRGQLGDLLKQIDAGDVPKLPADIRMNAFVDAPAGQVLTMNSSDVLLLSDGNGRPIRIGDSLAAIQGDRTVLIDTMADNEKEAIPWSGLAGIDASAFRQQNQQQPMVKPVAGLSRDGKLLVIADRDSIVALEVATAKVKWRLPMAQAGVSKPVVLSIGGGCMLAVGATGRMSCLDLDTVKIIWQTQLPRIRTDPNQQQPTLRVGVPQVGGDLVAVACNGGRSLYCYNIHTGKLVGKWVGQNGVDLLLRPDGLLVTVVDNELAARDSQHMTKPLWAKTYSTHNPGLLAIDDQRVALVVPRTGSQIEVFALSDGKKISTLQPAEAGGTIVPIYGRFDGKCLYVVTSSGYLMPRRLDTATMQVTGKVGVEKFQVEGKAGPLWAQGIPGSSQGTIMTPLEVGPKQVVFASRSVGRDVADFAYMLDASNGVTVSKFPLGGAEGGGDDEAASTQTDLQRRYTLGCPVMTNGRLCVETLEGVTVYGK